MNGSLTNDVPGYLFDPVRLTQNPYPVFRALWQGSPALPPPQPPCEFRMFYALGLVTALRVRWFANSADVAAPQMRGAITFVRWTTKDCFLLN